MKENRLLGGCLAAAACEILFGLSYLFTKQVTESIDSLTLLAWRFLIAFAVMFLCVSMKLLPVHLKGKNLFPLFCIAIFQPIIYFIAETLGIDATSASESGAFLACIPIATLGASALILKKKPAPMQLCGICITLAGVLLTVLAKGLTAAFSVYGYGMLLLAVISYSLYTISVEKTDMFTGIEKTYVMLGCGALVFSVAAVCQNMMQGTLVNLLALPFHNTSFLTAVLYQGVGCSCLAFFLSNYAIAQIGVNRTASFVGLSTVVSILAGIVLLHENFDNVQIIGVLLIIGGVYVANILKPGNQ